MMRYEVLFLAVPTITSDEAAALELQCTTLIKDHKAFLISFERWGKYYLAYQVRKNDYGVYFLVRFEVEDKEKQPLLNALKSFFAVKYNELVMRHVITTLGENGSLEYHRPESLDSAPTREYNTYQESSHEASSEEASFDLE